MRCLIVKLSAVGDCVCTLPALHRLRQCEPGGHIAWLVEDRCAPLLEGHPELNELIVVPRRQCRSVAQRLGMAAAIRRQLRAKQFDIAIDFQGLLKSAWGPLLAGIPQRVGFADAREVSRFCYTRRFPYSKESMHAVTRNLRLLQAALDGPGDPAPARREEFVLPQPVAARQAVDQFLSRHRLAAGPLAVFNVSAGKPANRWMPERFGELARCIRSERNLPVVLTGAGSERPLAEQVVRSAGDAGAINACGELELPGLAELLRRAAVLISGDSGPMHLAVAVGCPVVALFGSSDPARTGPYLTDRARVLWHRVPCAPCFKMQCPNPPATFLACLNQIEPAEVMAAVAGAVTTGYA